MISTVKFACTIAISIVVCVTMVGTTAVRKNCSLVGSDDIIGNNSTELVSLNVS